jgi:hypothetical protein
MCIFFTKNGLATFWATSAYAAAAATAAWDRCYDFLKYFRQKFQRKNWRF